MRRTEIAKAVALAAAVLVFAAGMRAYPYGEPGETLNGGIGIILGRLDGPAPECGVEIWGDPGFWCHLEGGE